MVYVTISEVLGELKKLTSTDSNLSMNKKRGIKIAIKHLQSNFTPSPATIYTVTFCEMVSREYNSDGTIISVKPCDITEPHGWYLNPEQCIADCMNPELFTKDGKHYNYAYITMIKEGLHPQQKIVKWLKFDGVKVSMPKHLKHV